MQTAIGYVRVSTEDQANEGVSLDAQKAKVAAWCLANGSGERITPPLVENKQSLTEYLHDEEEDKHRPDVSGNDSTENLE